MKDLGVEFVRSQIHLEGFSQVQLLQPEGHTGSQSASVSHVIGFWACKVEPERTDSFC